VALFNYKAIDDKGRKHSGQIDAVNEPALESRLRRMGMDLIKAKQVEDKRSLGGSGTIRRIDLINFCFHMEQLTRSGVSIIDGLQDLRDSVEVPAFRRIIAQVVEDIENGKKLSEAVSEHPKVFDEMFVSLIAAGEASGQLPDCFLSLSDMIKWQDELISTTKKLLIFPIFVGVVVFSVVGFLMAYLVPQLTDFIEGIGQELPAHTLALIATSDFIVNYWYLFTILPFLIYVTIKIRLALTRAREDIQDGKGVSASFQNTGLFPPLVVRMIRVGETTGQLDDALLNVSYFYNRDIKDSIEKVQALIQPVMTIIMGGILGWVMISVMGPVYDSISKMQF
jgi:type IV pilus assembly protein PilC